MRQIFKKDLETLQEDKMYLSEAISTYYIARKRNKKEGYKWVGLNSVKGIDSITNVYSNTLKGLIEEDLSFSSNKVYEFDSLLEMSKWFVAEL